MASAEIVRPPKRPGPPVPEAWRENFLQAYRTRGGIWRAAEKAGVSVETIRRERDRNPQFDAACHDARQYFADLVEEKMLDGAEEHGNPVGYIVRLKALRPAEYIEKHAMVSMNLTGNLDPADAARLVAAMLSTSDEATRAMLTPPPALQEPETP